MPQLQSPADDLTRRLERASERSSLLGEYADASAVHYVIVEGARPVVVSQPLDGTRSAHAYSQRFPQLSWDEREMADAWRVAFDALPDPRPFFMTRSVNPAAVVAGGEGLVHFVVGPVHAGVNEPGRFTFSSGGETIVHLDAQLSFTHRGVEGYLQGMTALQAAPYVARICGSCSVARSHAYALALEEIAGVTVPRDVELARVVVAELERIYNHISDLSGSAAGAGFGPGAARGLALKEEAMRLNRAASGHRLLFDAIVPGGVDAILGADLVNASGALARLAERVERYAEDLFSNGSLVSRWRGAGIVEARTAGAFGAVGPSLRASGGDADVRTLAPYGAYGSLLPRVATAQGGDVLARCAVKRAEITESFRLIREALGQLRGPLARPLQLSLRAGVAAGLTEGPRGAETVALHVDGAGSLRRIHFIAASYRNWPLVAEAMAGNIVPDFPLVNHSFSLCYACADR